MPNRAAGGRDALAAGLFERRPIETQPAVIDGQQDRVRPGGVDVGGRIQRLLHDLIVGRRHQLQGDPMPRRRGWNEVVQEVEGRVGEDAEPEGRERMEDAPVPEQPLDGAGQGRPLTGREPGAGEGLHASTGGRIGLQSPAALDEIVGRGRKPRQLDHRTRHG